MFHDYTKINASHHLFKYNQNFVQKFKLSALKILSRIGPIYVI